MHNHILFGVDDGCKTIDESIEMIQKAVSVGVTDMILTPHYAPMRGYVASNDEINKNFTELQNKVQGLNIPINLFLGREIDEVKDLEQLLNSGEVKTLNNTKYVLLDFGMKKADVDEYIYEMIIAGYKPIIAHPERYNYITDFTALKEFRKTGALLQINASSYFRPKNKQTKKLIQYIVKNGIVDLIGSDCHRNPKNYDDFSNLVKILRKKGIELDLNYSNDLVESIKL